MATFAEVLAGCPDEAILERLVQLYPDQVPASYAPVLARLRSLTPTPVDYELRLADVEGFGGETWVDVSGYLPADDTDYSMSYTPWSEWLGMKVRPYTLEHWPAVDIAVYTLWEMTYDGFDEERIQAKGAELLKMVEDVKSGKTETVPLGLLQSRIEPVERLMGWSNGQEDDE